MEVVEITHPLGIQTCLVQHNGKNWLASRYSNKLFGLLLDWRWSSYPWPKRVLLRPQPPPPPSFGWIWACTVEYHWVKPRIPEWGSKMTQYCLQYYLYIQHYFFFTARNIPCRLCSLSVAEGGRLSFRCNLKSVTNNVKATSFICAVVFTYYLFHYHLPTHQLALPTTIADHRLS